MNTLINKLRLKYFDYYERYLRRRYKFEFPRNEMSVNEVNSRSLIKDSLANVSSDIIPLISALKIANINPRKSTLIDIGCGTGKIVSLGAVLNFKKVIGIEMDSKGLVYSKKNMANTKHPNYEILNADATTYEIPTDVNVIYFFNPFGAASMSIVAENIKKSYQKDNRKIYVVYQNPVEVNTLLNAGFTKKYEQSINPNKVYFTILELG